jgi:hypothetical protein
LTVARFHPDAGDIYAASDEIFQDNSRLASNKPGGMGRQVASNVPSPNGTRPNVAIIEATAKLGKATRIETFCPTARNIAHRVAASSRKIDAWKASFGRARRR